MEILKRLKIDSKNRLALGKLVPEGVSSFEVSRDSEGRLILSPLVEIPARELWLFQNKNALQSLKRGLKQSAEGKVSRETVDFEKYLDDED